jgi:ribosomal protein S18 acetylase RimI-like enzyme
MPKVEIRAALASDVPILMAIDHSCETDYVWQMDIQREDGQLEVAFREIRLPHAMPVAYPRPIAALAEAGHRRSGMLVAVIGGQVIAYVRMSDAIVAGTAWMTDLVVSPRYRRQGIATALVVAVHGWAVDRKNSDALLEMSSKNKPAVCLAQKLGYEFCGYNDHYYDTKDVALFFGRSI